jgi:predicted phosphoribosyltransferase
MVAATPVASIPWLRKALAAIPTIRRRVCADFFIAAPVYLDDEYYLNSSLV